MRWLRQDRDRFLETLDRVVEEMREIAGLHALPNSGSRLMVELAVYTLAADAAPGDARSIFCRAIFVDGAPTVLDYNSPAGENQPAQPLYAMYR